MTAQPRIVRSLVLLVGVISISAAPLGTAQDPGRRRLGRPLDWSHAHLVAARGGPDRGLSIYSDWRTLFRHIEIDQAKAAIEQRRQDQKRAFWLPNSGAEQDGAHRSVFWLGLPGLALASVALVGSKLKKRSLRASVLLALLLLLLALKVACAGGDPASTHSILPGKTSLPTTTSDLRLDWSLNTGGFGNVISFPAKFSFDITASNCSDVIYFTVDQSGGPSTVNVIAITNPYAGCPGNPTGSTPTVKFGIAMGTGTATSPVLSLNGAVLYLFESQPTLAGGAILHAINVNNITTNPGTYDFGTGTWTSVHALAAPTGLPGSEQLFQLTFIVVDNVRSSPYLDYAGNQIFFGDAVGNVHRIINTNTTTASEDTTNFPVNCGVRELRAPVFVNGQVIVTSADGKVYRIDTTVAPPFTCVASAAVGTGKGAGELASPVIDVTNSKIIVTTGVGAVSGRQLVALLPLNFASGAAAIATADLGAALPAGNRPRIPAFDNAFLTANVGNLYAGGEPSAGGNAYLIRVPYNGATLSPAAGFAELHHSGAASNAKTSPVTAFLTASTLPNPDFVYIGGGSGSYPFMNRISSGFAGTDATPVPMDGFFALPGGMSAGIIIDNRTGVVTGTGATANIYFGTLGAAATSTQSTVVQLAQQF